MRFICFAHLYLLYVHILQRFNDPFSIDFCQIKAALLLNRDYNYVRARS